jgi:hypothetical protein
LKEITDQKRNGFEPQGAYIFDNISYAPLPVCINFEEIDNFATIQRFPKCDCYTDASRAFIHIEKPPPIPAFPIGNHFKYYG